jgi:hypothetical protein
MKFPGGCSFILCSTHQGCIIWWTATWDLDRPSPNPFDEKSQQPDSIGSSPQHACDGGDYVPGTAGQDWFSLHILFWTWHLTTWWVMFTCIFLLGHFRRDSVSALSLISENVSSASPRWVQEFIWDRGKEFGQHLENHATLLKNHAAEEENINLTIQYWEK